MYSRSGFPGWYVRARVSPILGRTVSISRRFGNHGPVSQMIVFVEERRSRFADAILEQIEQIKKKREGATDKRGFDHRLKVWGGALAALDGKEVG